MIEGNPLISPEANIEVHSDAGAVTLTGTVQDKDIKRAIGDYAWWMPGVTDVLNNITVGEPRKGKKQERPMPSEKQGGVRR